MSVERPDPDTEPDFARMQRDLPRVAPRSDLFDQISAALPARDAAPSAAPARARPRWRLRRPTFAIPAGVALAALIAALVIAVAVPGGPSPDASAPLVAHGTSGVHGHVDLFDPSTTNGRVVVHLKGLSVAPAGDHYTIWVLRDGVREMTPVASIASGEDSRIDLPLPGPGRTRRSTSRCSGTTRRRCTRARAWGARRSGEARARGSNARLLGEAAVRCRWRCTTRSLAFCSPCRGNGAPDIRLATPRTHERPLCTPALPPREFKTLVDLSRKRLI